MKSGRELTGFTLIELLVVIAIISLLSSVVLASLSSARESARDSRRASDFDQLRKAVQAYITDNTAYPGVDDDLGVRLSEECTGTGMYQDLVDGGYLQEMPTDPIDDVSSCNDLYQKK
jgi:type II secretion system protein G